MAIFQIILQLILALPSIIKVIKEIIDLIHGLPADKQGEARTHLADIIASARSKSFVSSEDAQRLEKLLGELRSGKF